MRNRIRQTTMAAMIAVSAALVAGCETPASGQGQGAVPRASDGKPDFSGIWQVMNSANWDLQAHAARRGPVVALGAAFSIPPSPGAVAGNEIPYLPAALAKKRENAENWMARDPEVK